MILIAESGATKTDWRLVNGDDIRQARSAGINPNYMKVDAIHTVITDGLIEFKKEDIHNVYFYGSGCSSQTNKTIIQSAVNSLFPNAHVEVNHDLLAAARSLCGHDKGIACILGTGSNSGLYDGKDIVENVISLGYMLGDEGSGTYLGKKLLVHYLRRELPEKVSANFQSRFKMPDSEIVEKVYKSERPQQFISQFSKFVFQNIKNPFLYKMVYDAFVKFMEVSVKPYTGYDMVPVHFTGSVAFYFGNILRQVGADMGINVRHIVEGPIAGLVLYHQRSQN